MLLLLSNNMRRRRTKNKWKNPALRDISGGENSLVSRLATRKTKTQATWSKLRRQLWEIRLIYELRRCDKRWIPNFIAAVCLQIYSSFASIAIIFSHLFFVQLSSYALGKESNLATQIPCIHSFFFSSSFATFFSISQNLEHLKKTNALVQKPKQRETQFHCVPFLAFEFRQKPKRTEETFQIIVLKWDSWRALYSKIFLKPPKKLLRFLFPELGLLLTTTKKKRAAIWCKKVHLDIIIVSSKPCLL